jgi:hypothetical protein
LFQNRAVDNCRRLDAVLEAMDEEETTDRQRSADDQKGAAS